MRDESAVIGAVRSAAQRVLDSRSLGTACRRQASVTKISTMPSTASRHKSLTETFHRVEREGLVTRHLDPGHVETATLYQLTDLGRSLDEPVAALNRWTDVNWPHV